MRHFTTFLTTLGLSLFLALSAQADTIQPGEASHYVGQFATVEGVVSQVSTSSGGTTFINFGGRYPNHVFYAVIFRGDRNRFPGVQSLEGRTIAINGTIELYKGKPEIVVSSPDQIELR